MLISSVDHVFSMARNTENKHSWPDPSPQSSVPVEKGNIEERQQELWTWMPEKWIIRHWHLDPLQKLEIKVQNFILTKETLCFESNKVIFQENTHLLIVRRHEHDQQRQHHSHGFPFHIMMYVAIIYWTMNKNNQSCSLWVAHLQAICIEECICLQIRESSRFSAYFHTFMLTTMFLQLPTCAFDLWTLMRFCSARNIFAKECDP